MEENKKSEVVEILQAKHDEELVANHYDDICEEFCKFLDENKCKQIKDENDG